MNLGLVLELVHTSDERWTTLRAEGTEWREPALLTEAFLRAVPHASTVVSHGDPAAEPVSTEPWQLWIRQPSTYRTHFMVGDEKVTAVVDGHRWWSISPSRGARTNDGKENYSHGPGPGEALFSFQRPLGALFFEVWEEVECVGRPGIRTIAHPITAEERTPYDDSQTYSELHGIGSGADEYELIVDAERGVLLRAEARLKGKPFRVLEVSSVAFDEVLADDIFRLEPPPGTNFTTA